MSINHNRIKVADLEKNQPNKILTTNTSGELEFSEINDIKIDSYNALDYTIAGKALDARQGKILKDLVDNINILLTSDNVNLDTVQELVNAIKTVQTSLSTILVNDLSTGGTTKALTAEMGKSLKALIDALTNSKLDIANISQDIETEKVSTTKVASVKQLYDWSASLFQTWVLGINRILGVTYTVGLNDYKTKNIFSNSSPIALSVPSNTSVTIPIGTKFSYTVQGSGTVTIIGAGITFIQKNLVYTTGDTFFLEKTDTNTWVVEGNVPAPTVVIGNVYIHASAGFGNDSTAQLGNPARPFLTLSAAMSAAESNNLYRTFIFMTASSGPYYMNGSFGAGQYTFYSDFPVIISLQNNALSGLIMTNSTDLIIDIPTGTVDFRSTIVKNQTQLWGVKVSIKCRTYIMNDGFIVRGNPLNLICEELIHHGGFLNPSNGSIGGIIKANTITSTTAGISDLTQSGDNFILDFNQCTTTNGLVLAQYCRSATINHGNYTCGSSATFTYVVQWHPNAVITINYKGDCLVSGNVRLSQQIANQILKFTGCVTYTGTVPLFYRVVGLAKFFNCQIKCAVLTTQFFVNNYVAFEFTNCYIECGYDFLDFSNVGPMTFTSPIARFKGNNVVYMTSIPQNYIKASSTTNNMIIEVIGNLRTNGILQPGVTQSNLIT